MDLPADEITLPDDWRIDGISLHATFSRGVSWSKDEETSRDSGTLVVSIPNIRDGWIDFDSKFNHYLASSISDAKLLRLGDIVFVGSSGSLDNVARCALVTSLPAKHVAYASFTFVGRPRSKDIDGLFLYYALRSPLFPVSKFCKRAADGKFNFQLTDFIRNFRLPFPPPAEQRQIALILTAVQRAIERQQRLIALTLELKRALMHKLFTEGTRGEPLKQTEIGSMPDSWAVHPLRELCSIKHGHAFDGEYFRPEGKRILMTPGHFHEDGGFRHQRQRTKYYVGEVPAGYTLAPDDLLVAMTEQKAGLLGAAALVPDVGEYLHNQRLGRITALREEKLEKHFLCYWFNRAAVKARVASTATGSKVRHTSPGKILDLRIGLPSTHEQRLIVAVLEAVDRKREQHEQVLDALSHLFRTLLHQLMTAQVRTHDLDLSAIEEPAAEPALAT